MQDAAQQFRIPKDFLRRLHGSVLLSPVILVVLLGIFILSTGQIREILIRVVEQRNDNCHIQLPLGFGAFALLAITLFYGYLSACVALRQTGIGYGRSLLYKSDVELFQDRRIMRWRDVLAVFCAATPLMAVGIAYWYASASVAAEIVLIGEEVSPKPVSLTQLCAGSPGQLPAQLARTAQLWIAGSILTLATIYLLSKIERVRGHRMRIAWRSTRTRHHRVLTVFAAAVLILPVLLIKIDPATNEHVFTVIGPLATLGLVLMSTAWFLFAVAQRSRLRGIPYFTLTAIFVFGFGFFIWMTRPGIPPEKGAAENTKELAKKAEAILQTAFENWLDHRTDAKAYPAQSENAKLQPYPVYVIAAPGGGIYAASFVASVVSRLESDCPGFSQHIFAISAVSGGAIGSSIINAISQTTKQVDKVRCYERQGQGNTQIVVVKRMLSDDHLSPTMANTIPDVIAKLVLIAVYEAQRLLGMQPAVLNIPGRAEALENSLTAAVTRACDAVKDSKERLALCTDHKDGGPLLRPYDTSWDPSGVAPALLLNTTLAETGERIAYSPFPLAGLGDGNLKAMRELPDSEPETLVEAAVASARFPAVLPAKIHSPQRLWWNFVDGGYADASGTTAALEIYKVIEALKNKKNLPIDLKLLLLTESSTEPTLPTGAGLSHAISPITTLLTIRDQIGRRAVDRVLSDLEPEKIKDATVLDCGGKGEHARMLRIQLDRSSINLPLGWMLSRHTADTIDHLVNFPEKVTYPASNKLGPQVAKVNEETFLAIKQSLTGKCENFSSLRQPAE
jgi:hypothetical protein